jgi:hypothetical protein
MLGGDSKRQGVAGALVKCAVRSIGSQVGREIARGVLGSILCGRGRRKLARRSYLTQSRLSFSKAAYARDIGAAIEQRSRLAAAEPNGKKVISKPCGRESIPGAQEYCSRHQRHNHEAGGSSDKSGEKGKAIFVKQAKAKCFYRQAGRQVSKWNG